ncbi:hypothetical protein CN918_29115 [Priestia megaterium]|nr:hypothetical protein CN918_29115 [Priestia megaterium]
MNALHERVFQVNQIVHAAPEEKYNEYAHEPFEVVKSYIDENDGGNAIYVIKSKTTKEEYEAYASMLISQEDFQLYKNTPPGSLLKRKRKTHISIVGKELRRLRKAAKMTTVQLASASNMVDSSITRYEKEEYAPIITTLISMLETLNNNIEGYEEKHFPLIGSEVLRMREYRELTIKEVSAASHLSISFLERVENGQFDVDLEHVIRILKALAEE